ncbi:MAG: hypothetical protein ACR2NU_05975 [Aeoliella sp.]
MPHSDQPPFDPYYRWLGIAALEQPPNHYRLLGLNLFESDSEVIALAADRQMSHIKSLATGEHATQSQQLLNELARARVVLLNAKEKERYDDGLREQHAPPPPPPPTTDAPHPAPFSAKPTLEVTDTVNVVRARVRHRRRQKASNAELILLMMAIGAAIVGGLLFYLQSLTGQ